VRGIYIALPILVATSGTLLDACDRLCSTLMPMVALASDHLLTIVTDNVDTEYWLTYV
jgi:hypothetical protein